MKCWSRAKEILSSSSTTNQGIEDIFNTMYYFSETKIYDNQGLADDAIENYTWIVEMRRVCGTIRDHPTIKFDISVKLSAPHTHTRLVSTIHCACA